MYLSKLKRERKSTLSKVHTAEVTHGDMIYKISQWQTNSYASYYIYILYLYFKNIYLYSKNKKRDSLYVASNPNIFVYTPR